MRDIDRVKVLLQSSELADQRLQLVEYEQRLRSGFLSNQDRNYIRALHAWHIARTGTENAQPDRKDTAADAAEAATIADLRARIVALEGELQRAHRDVQELEELAAARLDRMNDLERRIEQRPDNRPQGTGNDVGPTPPGATPGATDDRFQQVRRRFAQLYHPDNNADDGIEKLIRAEIFKEFWKELEAIEQG